MKKYLPIFITLMLVITASVFVLKQQRQVSIIIPAGPEHYIGQVGLSNSPIQIRVLILKHCFEAMADGDARLAIEAINLANGQGLNISEIGNLHINKDGEAKRRLLFYSPATLKAFINTQVKINAQAGDTLVIMTIGHGSNNGYLDTLGKRQDILKIFAEVAEENQQETLWWQLSCYASSRLEIKQCTPGQLEYFSIVASSNATTPSPAYVEGKVMQKVFMAMATKDRKLDANQDDVIVAKELADYLDTVKSGRGSLVYAASPSERLFGPAGIARKIPIEDRNGPQGKYPEDYVPFPRNKIDLPRF